MKRHTITLPMLIFIAVLLVSMAVFPTAASGTRRRAGCSSSGAALSLARHGLKTFDIIASAHTAAWFPAFRTPPQANRLFQRGPLQRI